MHGGGPLSYFEDSSSPDKCNSGNPPNPNPVITPDCSGEDLTGGVGSPGAKRTGVYVRGCQIIAGLSPMWSETIGTVFPASSGPSFEARSLLPESM